MATGTTPERLPVLFGSLCARGASAPSSRGREALPADRPWAGSCRRASAPLARAAGAVTRRRNASLHGDSGPERSTSRTARSIAPERAGAAVSVPHRRGSDPVHGLRPGLRWFLDLPSAPATSPAEGPSRTAARGCARLTPGPGAILRRPARELLAGIPGVRATDPSNHPPPECSAIQRRRNSPPFDDAE